MVIENACKDCGKLAEIDNDKSNENWIVYGTECKDCGGRIELKIK